VSSDISLAQAARRPARGAIRRAVEIETLRAQAEVEPVKSLAAELAELNRTVPKYWALTCATCGWRSMTRRSRSTRRPANDGATDNCPPYGALIAFLGAFIAEPLLLSLCRMFGIYAVVQERTSRVYMLFGKVVGVLDEPGFHFLPANSDPRLSSSIFG